MLMRVSNTSRQWPRAREHFRRTFSMTTTKSHQVLEHFYPEEYVPRTDSEWLNAKPYSSMPGPSSLGLIMKFLPGGKLHNSNLVDMNRVLREEYGDIFLLKGTFGKPDTVFTFDPKDYENTYRNEGIWPVRVGLETFTYYRKVKRPDVFKGIGGLVSEQGKAWADIRNKVNPILMKLQNVRQNLPQIDGIAQDFITRLESIRDPSTGLLREKFVEELKMWAFESISFVALNKRMGLMTGQADPNAHTLAKNMSDFFQLSYEFDVAPSFWMYYETAGFKHLMNTFESITEITTNYIDEAMRKFEAEGNAESKSVLEKLCRIDKQVAVVMAMDMLMAGIDTTSSAFTTLLYHLARNPEKQENLRQEVMGILPTPDTPLTEENTKQMPYLRACLKEALRITPITPGNFRLAARDLVLSGYQVPKGTGILMETMSLCNQEEYFARPKEYMPERWLKSGPTACPAAKSSNPFVYLPFGFGPRTCIGKRIAEMEIETLVARLVRKYRVTWQGTRDIEYTSNIILIPKSSSATFKFEAIQ